MSPFKKSLFLLGASVAAALAQPAMLNLPPIAEGPYKPDWDSLAKYESAPD